MVVVNIDNPVDELSLGELNKIFKAELRHWEFGDKIFVFLPRQGSNEKKILLDKVFHMSERELKKYWITMIYGNRISNSPKVLPSSKIIQKVVEVNKNAIGVIRRTELSSTVKALKIDGLEYRDPGYFLQD